MSLYPGCVCVRERERVKQEKRETGNQIEGLSGCVYQLYLGCVCVWVDCILCVSHHRSHTDSWGNTTHDINDDKVYCMWGNPVYLHQTCFTNPLMSWSNIAPMPNLRLRSQQILACVFFFFFFFALPRSVLSTEKWCVRQAARPRMQPAKPARCFDPRWPPESQHGSTASLSQGWIHRHSVSGACQGYLHHLSSCNTTFTSFFSVVVTLNICHLVGALITVQPVKMFFSRKTFIPVGIKPPTRHHSVKLSIEQLTTAPQ